MENLVEEVAKILFSTFEFDQESKIEMYKKMTTLSEEKLNDMIKVILTFKKDQARRQQSLISLLKKRNNNMSELMEKESEEDLESLISNL